MPWGVAAAVGGAVVSSALAPSPSDIASASANAADPFSSQRGQYQSMLSDLLTGDPAKTEATLSSQPGYQFGLNQAIQSTQGSAAAAGMLNSGNALSAIQQTSQGYADQQFYNYAQMLMQLSGANTGNPGMAGSITAQQGTSAQNSASALGSQLGNLISNNSSGISSALGFGTSSSGSYESQFNGGSNSYGFTSGLGTDYSSGVSYGFGV